jgi:hypothetical protein
MEAEEPGRATCGDAKPGDLELRGQRERPEKRAIEVARRRDDSARSFECSKWSLSVLSRMLAARGI